MANTQQFRQQHDDLLTIATKMAESFDVDSLSRDAKEMRALLSELAGKLKVHLAMEDKHLYPKLLAHEDIAVRTTAQKFIDEMGGIAQVFTTYLDRWPHAKAIQGNAAGFIEETKGLFNALGNRINRENNNLYPLLEN